MLIRNCIKGKSLVYLLIIILQVTNDPYFECDQPKGTVAGGVETIVSFKFKPPQVDTLLKDIGALKGLGQWVESIWDLKLQGGYFETGMPDPQMIEVVLRAYVQQI